MLPDTALNRAREARAEGESALTERQLAAAEARFGAALKLVEPLVAQRHPEAPGVAAGVRVGLGRVRLVHGQPDLAAEEFEKARQLLPEDGGPSHWLGCAAAHRGAYEAAEGHFTAALAGGPRASSLIQRAYVRVRLGRTDAAREDLRAAARLGDADGGGADGTARAVLAVLSGRPRRELALLVHRAALGGLTQRAGPGASDWHRAASLLMMGRQLTLFPEELTPLTAITLALGGRRARAIALLSEASRQAPERHRRTHTLGLLLLHSLSGADAEPDADAEAGGGDGHAGGGGGGSGEDRWGRCVAAWGGLLHDRAFWERRRTEAERRYRTPVSAGAIATLRDDLRVHLERLLPTGSVGGDGHGSAGGGRGSGGPSPDLLFRREAEAARLLEGVGGFPLPGRPGVALVCGPLRIAELGRVAEFGTFVAARDERRGGPGSPLAIAFSQLGLGYVLSDAGRYAEAVAELTDLRCPDCRAAVAAAPAPPPPPPPTGPTGPTRRTEDTADTADAADAVRASPAVCRPGCIRFGAINPAYASHQDRAAALALDAVTLAVETRLHHARAALTAAAPDIRSAVESWRHALVQSRVLGRYGDVQRGVVDVALGKAAALHRADRPDEAVAVLDWTRSITGANERDRLEGQLARLLTDRGISSANADMARLEKPADDLRRAVALNPHLLRAQRSLGVVLHVLGTQRWRSGSRTGARQTLREAVDRLDVALTHFPDDPELKEQRERAVTDLSRVSSELTGGRG